MRLRDLFRPHRRKVGLKAVDVELEEPLRPVDVLEPVDAEVAHGHSVDLVLDELARRVGQQHLPAVRNRADARRPVDADAHVALVPDDGLAGVQADADADLAAVGPIMGREGALDRDGGAQRRARAREREEEGVALRVDLATVTSRHGLADDLPVLLEKLGVAVAKTLKQPCRALDVGEEEGDGPARELDHRVGVRPGRDVVKALRRAGLLHPPDAWNRRRPRIHRRESGASRTRTGDLLGAI